MVTAARVPAPSPRLLDPAAADWATVREETLALEPTPWASQPSEYARNAWKDRRYGQSGPLRVAAAHNDEALFFRLSWKDETEDVGMSDNDRFADACAILFPLKGDAPLTSMGSPEQPVYAWYWRPELEGPISVTATGLGTTVRQGDGSLSAAASYGDGGWQVVMSRPLIVRGIIALRPGLKTKVGFAVWEGSNQERAGIKAVTLVWQPLEIER